jgi:hypothetical protein
MSKAAPRPEFRGGNQPSLQGITVDISKLLEVFLVSMDVEIVVTRQLESYSIALQVIGDVLFQHLDRAGKRSAFWFAQEQVNVFRHDNISVDKQTVPLPATF